MWRATAHQARGQVHWHRGNGPAARAHFARARALRSAFGNDPVYDAAYGILGEALRRNRGSALHDLLKKERGLARAAEVLAENLRQHCGPEVPRFEFVCGDQTRDMVRLHYGARSHTLELRVFNGGIIIGYSRKLQQFEGDETPECRGPEGLKRQGEARDRDRMDTS